MSYRNGKDILPNDLLKELQKYIQGDFIYVPKEKDSRASWGEKNGTRKNMKIRNINILRAYEEGDSIEDLMEEYNLSQDSIRKIILKTRKIVQMHC